MPAFIDLTGKVFERLTVKRRDDTKNKRVIYWICECSCGKTCSVSGGQLSGGKTKSCGCYKLDKITKHGQTVNRLQAPEYRSYHHMIQRCTNPNNDRWEKYGGRGIKVCDRWIESFQNFVFDVGPSPGPGYSIGRIDNDGDYEPGNCRWETPLQQQRNTSWNRLIEWNGKTKCISEWAEATGIPAHSISNRLIRGWSVERTLTEIPKPRKRWMIEWRGETRPLLEWAKIVGVKPKTIQRRLELGWSVDEALTFPTGTNLKRA